MISEHYRVCFHTMHMEKDNDIYHECLVGNILLLFYSSENVSDMTHLKCNFAYFKLALYSCNVGSTCK